MRTRDVKSVEVKVSTELQPGPSAKRMALGSIAAKSHDMHLRQPVGGQGLHPFPPSTEAQLFMACGGSPPAATTRSRK